ncbi:hypothetical protein E3Q10_03142 [Wallemia mellicola]|uniref:U4/U6.U5 small nuclear ribonucleoprotein 27kDa protein domain-containing protein n=1 Tax=Wallemia mellicola TaxID=1708541 RepID=A0A4T0QP57_9BASI|nr:hypothetical protein E3Q11_02999 [Wallemia mellicola]TIC28499.1 hypothetical protein E3Q10_03142 [Wallemia mellicola]TIC73290.1 hypothetical protein E3Q00_03094 [Wallemia mellicola]
MLDYGEGDNYERRATDKRSDRPGYQPRDRSDHIDRRRDRRSDDRDRDRYRRDDRDYRRDPRDRREDRRDYRDHRDHRDHRRRSRSPPRQKDHKLGGIDLRDGSAADRERMLKYLQSKEAEEERKRAEEEERAKEEEKKEAHNKEEIASQEEEQEEDIDEDSLAMQQMMGFGGFDTTKGKKVVGNEEGAAKVHQPRTYRQYMNRVGGFNRALDKAK